MILSISDDAVTHTLNERYVTGSGGLHGCRKILTTIRSLRFPAFCGECCAALAPFTWQVVGYLNSLKSILIQQQGPLRAQSGP